MARYIDADAIVDKLNKMAKEYLADKTVQCDIAAGVVCDIKDVIIANAPAADVEEVKHGEWEFISQRYPKRILRCLNCGYIREIDVGQAFPKLCEDCGAIMDGREFRRNEI